MKNIDNKICPGCGARHKPYERGAWKGEQFWHKGCAEKAEADNERLRVQVERLEGRVDEPCDGCTDETLKAVREIVDHFDCTNPERDRDKIRDALDGKGE